MKSKNAIWLILLAVATLAVASQMKSPATIAGWATMSLSSVDFLSNDPTLAGKAWLMTVSLNGNGQYAVSQNTFDPSQIKDVSDAVKARNSLTIKAETSPMNCQYAVDNRNKAEPVYSLNYEKRTSYTEGVTHSFYNTCKAYGDYYYWYSVPFPSYDYYCFRKTHIGTHGVLQTPKTIWSAKITASTSSGSTESKTISNWGTQSAWLGSNVYVSWNGDLVGAESCPTTNLPDAVFKDGSWKTTDRQAFSDYWTYYQGGFASCVQDNKVNSPDTCNNNFNIKATNAVVPKALSLYTTEGKTYSVSTGGSNVDSGQIDLIVEKNLRNPVLSFKIRGDWVGIVVETGIPDIISASNVEFTTGSSGISNIQVRNVGTAQGAFDYSATCSEGISQNGKNPDKLYIAPSQTATAQLYLTGSSASDRTGSCTLSVYDVNNPNNKDTATISVRIKTICEATEPAGTKKCSGNSIVESDGCRYRIVQSCASGCVYQQGVPVCVTAPPVNSTCVPNWQTSEWSSCERGKESRTVSDTNKCGIDTDKPSSVRPCNSGSDNTYLLYAAAAVLVIYAVYPRKKR